MPKQLLLLNLGTRLRSGLSWAEISMPGFSKQILQDGKEVTWHVIITHKIEKAQLENNLAGI